MDMLQAAAFYRDDSQIAAGDVLKIYASVPGVWVTLTTLDGAAQETGPSSAPSLPPAT